MASQRDTSVGDRLNSWKEIAQHLAVSVRTAMRWEKSEGLPAHRHKHDKLSSVYASRVELDRWWNSRPDLREPAGPAPPPARESSLAVLPFLNFTASEAGEILADGLTEELITVLAQFPALRVVARTSSFYFKDKPADARSIARQLGVSMLLEGSVRISGDRLRVAAQLIEAPTGFHIWAEQFDRPLDDLLEIQSSIACAISHALKIRLSTDPAPATAVGRIHGGDPEAYRLWLRGRYHLNRLSPDAIGLAIESFQRALDRDPQMAPAWGGIAQCYAWLASVGGLPVAEAVVRAKQAISQALAINEATADAHLCLGMLAMGFDYDWAAAERECRRTLELNPAHSEGRLLYAGMLGATGRSAEGRAQIMQAYEQDPASANVICGLAAHHVFAGRNGEALRALDRALALQPELPVIYYWLALVYLIQADYEQLETICRRVLLPHLTAGFLGCCCARTGRRDEACRILRELESPALGPSRAYQVAVLQLGLDNPAAAIASLDQARQCGCFGVLWLASDPLWTALRKAPGFTAVLQKMNLV